MTNDAFDNTTPPSFSAGGPDVATDDISFRMLYELIRAGAFTIIVTALIMFGLGISYTIIAPPSFQADGLVQVEQDKSSGSGGASMTDIGAALFGSPVQTEAEIQVLQSRMILDQVIDRLNLQVDAKPKYLPLVGAAIARHRERDRPAAPILGLKAYAWGGEAIKVTTFDVPARMNDQVFTLVAGEDGHYALLSPTKTKLLDGIVGEPASIEFGEDTLKLFVQTLTARPGTHFVLVHHSRQPLQAGLAGHLKVTEQGHDSGVIQVTFSGSTREFVSQVINALEDAYLSQNIERRSADAQQSLDFLQKQLPQTRAKVEAAQAALNAYQQQHGSIDVSAETQAVLEQSATLEGKRLDLQQQREQALLLYTPEHPSIKALDLQMKELDGALGKVREKTQKLPTTQQEILRYTLDVDVNTTLYTEMQNSIQNLQIAKAGTVGNVRIIDHSLPPLSPNNASKNLILVLSAVIGLLLGITVVYVQKAMLRGVDDPTELEARFGLSTFASIPYSAKQNRLMRRGRSGVALRAGEHRLLAVDDSQNIAIEALRSFRTALHFVLLDSPNNVVMLTGPAPNLGKSFVASNLGALLAVSGKTAIVVDGDLRRGRLREYFGILPNVGLSDYIAGTLPPTAVISRTSVENLDFIDRGNSPPNPAELLLHDRFSALIKYLSEKYDYVLIDTPPVLAVTDAAIVGRYAGCTLLVLKAAEHKASEIEDSIRRLANAGVQVRGALLNQVGHKAGSYGYNSYGYEYHTYSAE